MTFSYNPVPFTFTFIYLMLVALLEFKLCSLNDTGKNQKLTTDFYNILTLSLARGFDFLLSLSVTTRVIPQVMGITWFGECGRDCFDMMKSLVLRDMARLFQISDRLIGSTLVDLCEIWLRDCLRCKLQGNQ